MTSVLGTGKKRSNVKRNLNIHFFIVFILLIFCRSYFTEKASGICKLLLDGTESMYLAVTNFVVMVVNTFEIDLSHVFSILDDIKVKKMLQFILTLFHNVQILVILVENVLLCNV